MIRKSKRVKLVVVGGGPRCAKLIEVAHQICEDSNELELVGFVMDRPVSNESNPRYTIYDEFREYPARLRAQADLLDLPTYCEKINGSYKRDEKGFSAFQRWLYNEALDRKLGDKKEIRLLFLMACFGQRWTRPTTSLAKGWFINTHPIIFGSEWKESNPCRGAQPYENMLKIRRESGKAIDCELIAHLIDHTFDNGVKLFGMGKEQLTDYDGRLSYDRRDTRLNRMVRCRFRTQGEIVHDMHVKMARWTGEITKKILTNRKIIKAILDGRWATKKLIREIFPEKKKNQNPKMDIDPYPNFDPVLS